MIDTKRAYDKAAEAYHSHVLTCSTCSFHDAPRCEVGERLLVAENEAWHRYQHSKRR